MNENLIEIFTITWNEEKILQDFIDWYRSRFQGCKITIFDNKSTDNTLSIAKENKCNVISFDTKGMMDEKTLMWIRNNGWKTSMCKFIIMADCDELIDIKEQDIINVDWNVVHCEGYEMFGTGEPISGLLEGCPSVGYSKKAVFDRTSVLEMNFGAGSHDANPSMFPGQVLKYSPIRFKMLHTKWRSWENGIERAHQLANKISQDSKSKGWNFHYGLPDSVHKDYYENGMKNKKKIYENI